MLNFEETELFGKRVYRRVLTFKRSNFIGDVYSYKVIDYVFEEYVSPEEILANVKPLKDVMEQRFLIHGLEFQFRKKFFLFGLRGCAKVLVYSGKSCKIPSDFLDLVHAFREVVER